MPVPYDPERVRRHIKERIRIEPRGYSTECWVWQSGINNWGYPTGRPSGCKHGGMHRHSYEAFVGPILPGLVIDHLCKVRAGVNPDHLEPVTQSQNLLRNENRWRGGPKSAAEWKSLAAARSSELFGPGGLPQTDSGQVRTKGMDRTHDKRGYNR
jgi:hypothetical protein